MTEPLGKLRFLYTGSKKFEADLKYYRDSIGAELLWNFKAFGARVAAFRVGEGPLVLIADHRPAPSSMSIYEAENLKSTVSELKKRGCIPDSGPFEIQNGPCYVFKDPSGNEFAIFQDVRPNALEQSYAESDNPRAVRD
jgi:predicted enzyme related to lactoylglutathione lyase